MEDIAADGTVTAKLSDFAGKGINGESVTAIVNGTAVNATTDKNGIFTIAAIMELRYPSYSTELMYMQLPA